MLGLFEVTEGFCLPRRLFQISKEQARGASYTIDLAPGAFVLSTCWIVLSASTTLGFRTSGYSYRPCSRFERYHRGAQEAAK